MAWEKTSSDATTFLDTSFVPVSGAGARTVFFKFKTTFTSAADERMGDWGTFGTGTAYRWGLDYSSSYNFRVEIGGGLAKGTVAGLNDGVWHSVAFSNTASDDISNTVIYIDGSLDSISASTARAINTGTTHGFSLGFAETTGGAVNGNEGAYAEAAVYSRALDSAEMIALTAGHITPASISRGRVLYWPLIREYVGLSGGGSPTLNGSNYTISAHPRVIYPSAQILQFPPTAAVGGFSPYWAAGSNVIMNNGSP